MTNTVSLTERRIARQHEQGNHVDCRDCDYLRLPEWVRRAADRRLRARVLSPRDAA